MAIYLESNQVPSFLRMGYSGAKFAAETCESVYIPPDAGLWSGGSRTVYTAIDLSAGKAMPLPGQQSAPWDANRTERKIELKPGFAIVAHKIFSGKDLGLTFYVHPLDVAKLLPASNGEELTETERKFLAIVRGIKSAYRPDYYARAGISKAEQESIKARLINLGMLNKAGAITVQGKNACEGVSYY